MSEQIREPINQAGLDAVNRSQDGHERTLERFERCVEARDFWEKKALHERLVAVHLLAEVERLTERVVQLEQERAQSRIDAFTNAARIADAAGEEGYDASALVMARRIAARLRARAAVTQTTEATC